MVVESMVAHMAATVRNLRGNRTRKIFSALVGVDEMTIYRWEKRKAYPDETKRISLLTLANREGNIEAMNQLELHIHTPQTIIGNRTIGLFQSNMTDSPEHSALQSVLCSGNPTAKQLVKVVLQAAVELCAAAPRAQDPSNQADPADIRLSEVAEKAKGIKADPEGDAGARGRSGGKDYGRSPKRSRG